MALARLSRSLLSHARRVPSPRLHAAALSRSFAAGAKEEEGDPAVVQAAKRGMHEKPEQPVQPKWKQGNR